MLAELRRQLEFFAGVDSESPEGIARRVEWVLHGTAPRPCLGIAALGRATLLPEIILRPAVERLIGAGKVLDLGSGHFMAAPAYAALLSNAEALIRAETDERRAVSFDPQQLRAAIGAPAVAWARIVEDLACRNVAAMQGGRLVLRGADDSFTPPERALLERIEKTYDDAGFQSPRPDELPALLVAPEAAVGRLVEYLLNEGRLVRLSPAVMFSRMHVRRAQEIVVRLARETGQVDSGDFKTHLGSSRKYALAVLDFLDARRVTLRSGNIRTLASGYEQRLL